MPHLQETHHLQSLPNIARPRAKPMDPSQALREDGLVIMGPLQVESTQNDPDPTTFVIIGSAGRWTEYKWVDFYDGWIEVFEKKWQPEIELLKDKVRTVWKLVVYKDRPQSVKYKPTDNSEHYWVFIPIDDHDPPLLGLAEFSKGSHIKNHNFGPCTPVGPLAKKSIVIFDGRLYRQEPEVKGEGIKGVLARYDKI